MTSAITRRRTRHTDNHGDGGTADGTADGARPSAVRLLANAFKQHRLLTLLAFLATFATVAFEMAIPLLTGSAVDTAVGNAAAGQSVTGIVLALVLVACGRYACQFTRRYLGGRLAQYVQTVLRINLLDTLQHLDGPGQDRIVTGQVVSRSISDLGLVQGMLMPLTKFAGDVVQLVAIVVIMLVISPTLTAIAVVVIPVVVLIAITARRLIYAATWSSQQATADLATHVEETVSGIRVVKAFGQGERETSTLARLGRIVYAQQLRLARLQARFQPLLHNVPQVALVATIVLGGLLAINGQITIGVFFAFSMYLTTLTQTTRMVSMTLVRFQMGLTAADRIGDVLAMRPDYHDPDDPTPLPTEEPLGLRFTDVKFHDAHDDNDVLHGLSFAVAPGESLALIGAPGAGKSMAVQLAGRFYRPDAGHIALTTGDGQVIDADRVATSDWRSAVVCVFDDAFLYSSSITSNIAMATDATEEEVRRAAKLAQADEFIEQLPDGYNTLVGERGLTLSGGQRQRIALARAILARPRVLVLDDATSAIDASTEAQIIAGLRRELHDVTIIAVAHRESTLELCDNLAIVSDGRVVDAGPREEVRRHPGYVALMEPDHDDAAHQQHEAEVASARARRRARTSEPAQELLWPGAAPAKEDPRLASSPGLRASLKRLPPATEQPKADEEWLTRSTSGFSLRRMFGTVKWLIVAVIALLIAGVLADLAFPTLMRTAVDNGVGAKDMGTLWLVAGVGLVLVVVATALEALRTVLTSRSGERLLFGLRLRSYAHLQRLSLSYFESTLSGRIMTRMTTDIDNLSDFLQTSLAQAVVSLATLIGIFVMLAVTAPQLSLIALAAVPIIVVATLVFRHISGQLYRAAREQVSNVNAQFHEKISGLRPSQMHLAGEDALEEFSAAADRYRDLRVSAQLAVSLYFPGVNFIAQLTTAAVLYLGAQRIADGTLTAGVLIAYVLYLSQLYGPIQQLGQIFDSWQQASVGFSRITDLLATKPTVPDEGRREDTRQAARGALVADHVEFRYRPDLPVVSGDLDVRIEPGTSVAVVGPTGAGKSTLIKLLGRFYDPTSGAITASGTDIREFPLTTWRRQVAQVPQEVYLFSTTVAGNIAYGCPEATREEITEAVREIGALDIIAGIPGGFDHVVGERGRGLSSGQRQIIALARAQLLDSPVLLLDEATATLDPATEAAVLDASERIASGRTSVVVAHRLATAQRADRILVVNGGDIVEDGTHDSLLERGGIYAEMWRKRQNFA